MLPSCRSRLSSPSTLLQKRRAAQSFKAFYAVVKGIHRGTSLEPEEPDASSDFILSILRANPSLRDTKTYLELFGHQKPPLIPNIGKTLPPPSPIPQATVPAVTSARETLQKQNAIISTILNPIYKRTALVKLQGPFSYRQLDSVARGLVYLEKLGLVSVIVVDLDDWIKGEAREKSAVIEETMRVVSALEAQGARARPVLQSVVRLGPQPSIGNVQEEQAPFPAPEAHTLPSDLISIRSALRAGEIPVLPPLALDSFCRSVRIHSNDVIGALVKGMAEYAQEKQQGHDSASTEASDSDEVDLSPLRLMIINREGGVPSYARSGLPHLLINLDAEFEHINDTFHESWHSTHPTSLSNLSLARTCLTYMPPTSSAIMVSHRSPKSLIGNLITNKPELSSSLPHALLQGKRRLTPHTPTILRRGLPIRVVRSMQDFDKEKMTKLLEQSFNRTLSADAYYTRLEKDLDYAIIAGDYAGAAIVTRQSNPNSPSSYQEPITYLDKFAVLPSHQGDGTVDFLWVALHDESYGLGLSFSVNPNGGKEGKGEGKDLVWRSRSNNPVNKWYFERSTGHLRMGNWVMFWCDAEKRMQVQEGRSGRNGLSYVENWEQDRLNHWMKTIFDIPSCWT